MVALLRAEISSSALHVHRAIVILPSLLEYRKCAKRGENTVVNWMPVLNLTTHNIQTKHNIKAADTTVIAGMCANGCHNHDVSKASSRTSNSSNVLYNMKDAHEELLFSVFFGHARSFCTKTY